MNDLAVEPMKLDRKFSAGVATVAILTAVLVVAFFAFQGNAVQDPLYNNALTVQTATDKSVYTQGENVTISMYVINGKNETIVKPSTVTIKVFDSTGQAVYSVIISITWASPQPYTFPAHSKTLYWNNVWNQKSGNHTLMESTLVESGSYTIEGSLGYGTS